MLFWGTNGVRRDIPAAVELFRQAADSSPSAMYDYGLLLLKGQGTQTNSTEGLEYLHKAAAQVCRCKVTVTGFFMFKILTDLGSLEDYSTWCQWSIQMIQI